MSNLHATLFQNSFVLVAWPDSPLKHNKYIFDIPIPFCHYPYPSKSLTKHIACRNLLRRSHVNGIAESGYGNDDLPWLYTQPLQQIGGANVCIVLGKWVCQTFIYGYIVTKYGCNCLKYIFSNDVCIILHSTYVFM